MLVSAVCSSFFIFSSSSFNPALISDAFAWNISFVISPSARISMRLSNRFCNLARSSSYCRSISVLSICFFLSCLCLSIIERARSAIGGISFEYSLKIRFAIIANFQLGIIGTGQIPSIDIPLFRRVLTVPVLIEL